MLFLNPQRPWCFILIKNVSSANYFESCPILLTQLTVQHTAIQLFSIAHYKLSGHPEINKQTISPNLCILCSA